MQEGFLKIGEQSFQLADHMPNDLHLSDSGLNG